MNSVRARDILALRTTFQNRLDLLDVEGGLRACSRLTLRRHSEAPKLAPLILELGLEISVGRVVRFHPAVPVNGFVDDFSGAGSPLSDEMICFYVARTDRAAKAARGHDEDQDDVKLGVALGYPDCCVAFVQQRGSVPRLSEALSLYAADGYYDPLIWPVALIHDGALTTHYPCSQGCARSKSMSVARWNLIQRTASEPIVRSIKAIHAAHYWAAEGGAIHSTFTHTHESRGDNRMSVGPMRDLAL